MKSQTLTLLLRCVMLAASLFAFQTLRAQAPPPTFTKITAAPFTVDIGNGHGCAWVDYDNDGFIDLFDSNYNIFQQLPSYLYRNNGNGTFTRQTNGNLVRYVGSTVTSAWADYDNDGFADVFIPDETARDFLYRNNGDGTFTNVAPFVLPAATNSFTWNAAWGDYDND
jgi:FG-GAP-like repeat